MRVSSPGDTTQRFRQHAFWALLSSVFLMVSAVPAAAQTTDENAASAQAKDEGAAQGSEADKAQKEEAPPADQPAPAEPQDEKSSKTYSISNGSTKYGRTEESEKRKTADGEIETHRVRMPSYGGDQRVLMERQTRTKKLPDGTIQKEHILKNPDGSNRLVPIEIIREKIKTDGDSTIIEREVLKQDYAGRWQPSRKERVTQTGPEAARQSIKEVREPTASGDWKLVDRQVTTEKAAESEKQSRSVQQVPDAHGRLADYEVRQERTTKDGDKEITDVSVQRRDMQDTDHPKLILVERSKTEQTKSADGRVMKKSTTESDLVAGGASRNVTPGAPKVVEEKTEVEVPGPEGASRRTVTVRERGAADREMRPSPQIVQETDSKGNVRQIFIPAR